MTVLFLLIGGVLLSSFSSQPQPAITISVPPPPESGFVPSSAEFSQERSIETREEQFATSEVEDVCLGNASTDFYCYEDYYVQLVREEGIAAAFADLKKRYESDQYVVAQCHPLAHVIGREATYKFKTPSEAYAEGDGFCWSGYYHGILETFLENVDTENLPQEINSVCADIEGKERYSFDYYNCVHGLGHGIMAITQDELFRSLDYCDFLTGSWEQESCASGVFMENVIIDNLNHFTKYLDPKRPLYPCTESPAKYKNTCYLMQTSYILKVNGGNFADTFSWCRKVEEPYRATCFQSLGRDASGRTSSDIKRTKDLCLIGKDEFERSNCVIGAVKDIISYFHSRKEADAFCASLEQPLAGTCSATTNAYYAQL